MTETDYADVRQALIRDEGLRLKPYRDTTGRLTIGVGRNLTDVGISELEAMEMLDHDIDEAVGALTRSFPWFQTLEGPRQQVLVNLCFNIGIGGVQGFKQMLADLAVQNYGGASRELVASTWSTQVGGRATRLATQMLTGEVKA
jgi:lysozyme